VVPANRILLVNDKAKFGRNSNWIIVLISEPKEDAMGEDVTHIWIAVHGRRVKEMLEALNKQGRLPLPADVLRMGKEAHDLHLRGDSHS
jgi:hypothetical protein